MPSVFRLCLAAALLAPLAGCDMFSQERGALTARGSLVGERVALDGESALLGAPGSNEVFFFERSGDAWSDAIGRRPTAAQTADPFYGQYLALSDGIAVVGAPEFSVPDDYAGHAYIYSRSGGTWQEAAVLRPTDLTPNAGFGGNVATSAGRVAVAAGRDGCIEPETRACGRVHVYEQQSGWARTARLESPPEAAFFGLNVALDGDRLVVLAMGGELGLDGVLYLYQNVGGRWQLETTITAPPLPTSSRFTPLGFGGDIALDGETLAVSEGGRDGGTVYLYRRRGASDWALDATLTRPRDPNGRAAIFGSQIDLDMDRLVAGSPVSRASFVYVRGANGAWTEEAELISGDSGGGRDVAISGARILIGSNSADDEFGGSGFLFERGPGGWTPVP